MVDILKEHIAVAEARKLNIPIFAIVDTNSNPNLVDYPIPANDDASKSISLIVKSMCDAIQEGLNERALMKDKEEEEEEEIEEEEIQEEKKEDDKGRGNRRRRIGEKEGDERRPRNKK